MNPEAQSNNTEQRKSHRRRKIAAVWLLVWLLIGAVVIWPSRVQVRATDLIGPASDVKFLIRVVDLPATLEGQDRLRGKDWLQRALTHLAESRGREKPGTGAVKIVRRMAEAIGSDDFIIYHPTEGPEGSPPIVLAPKGTILRRVIRWAAIKAWKDEDGAPVCRWVDAEGATSSLEGDLRGWWMLPLGAGSEESLRRAIAYAAKAPPVESQEARFGGYAEFIPRNPRLDPPRTDGFIRTRSFGELEALADYPLISFRQTASSLGDWEVRLGNPDFIQSQYFSSGFPIAAQYLRAEEMVAGRRPPIMVQVDGERDFVKALAKRLEFDLAEELERLKENDWVRPGLADGLQRALAEAASPRDQVRIGFALRPMADDPIPSAGAWEYPRRKLRGMAITPGEALPIVPTPERLADVRYWAYGEEVRRAETARQGAARRFFNLAWEQYAIRPDSKGFVAIDWYTLAESMAAFPAITLKKDKRDAWLANTALAESLAAALDSSALVLEEEVEGEGLVVWINSPPGEIPPSPPPPWPLKP